MKVVSCNVIQDLIPLYVEELLSEDSRKLVETHLDECEACSKELDILQSMDTVPIETDIQPLQKIQKTIQKKKWYAVLIAILMTLSIGTLIVIFTTAPEYLPYSSEVVTINEMENEVLSVEFDDSVAGYDIQHNPSKSSEAMNIHLTTWTTAWHKLTQTDKVAPFILNANGERVERVYYYQTDGTVDRIIYGEAMPNGGVMTLPRLSLNYYVQLAIVVLLIGLITTYLVRKNKKYLNRAIKVTLLPLVYIIASVIVTGWNATTYSPIRDFVAILLMTILIYSMVLLILKFRKIPGKRRLQ